MRHLLAFSACAVLFYACAPNSRGSPGSDDGDRITAQQIASIDAISAWDIIEKLRPHWLRSRGPRSLTDPALAIADVFVDGIHVGKIEVLQQMQISDVQEFRFLPPGRAAVRYGMGYPRGIIEVTRKSH